MEKRSGWHWWRLSPRAIWPGKPVTAGSGDLVSRVTGLTFANGTSVGIGRVLEFYANFSTAGVVIGFILMGTLVTLLDLTSRERLLSGDPQGFALWFTVGIALIQIGGALSEVTGTAVGAYVVVGVLNYFLLSDYRRKRKRPTPGGWRQGPARTSAPLPLVGKRCVPSDSE